MENVIAKADDECIKGEPCTHSLTHEPQHILPSSPHHPDLCCTCAGTDHDPHPNPPVHTSACSISATRRVHPSRQPNPADLYGSHIGPYGLRMGRSHPDHPHLSLITTHFSRIRPCISQLSSLRYLLYLPSHHSPFTSLARQIITRSATVLSAFLTFPMAPIPLQTHALAASNHG